MQAWSSVIGASLSDPHISEAALCMCLCICTYMLAAIYRTFYMSEFIFYEDRTRVKGYCQSAASATCSGDN